MNRISSVCIIVAACILLGAAGTYGQTLQLRGSGIYYFPSGSATTGGGETSLKDVEWDKGTGLELQAILWPANSLWGFGASIGKATWDITDYESSEFDYSYDAAFADVLEGDADLTIIGLSVFRKLSEAKDANKLTITAEGGIRFVSVDSSIEGGTAIADAYGALAWYQTLEIDDSIVGLLALALDYAVADNVSLFAQAGFQFDIDKGKVENKVEGLGTFEAGETEFQALFGKAGLSVSF
jgi:hypothetical protein